MIRLATANLGVGKQIVPFQRSHMYQIELKGFEREYLNAFPDYIDHIANGADPDHSWTGIVFNKIVCIFGISMLWPGVGEMWMIPSVHISDSPIAVVRASKKIISETITELDLWRLQVTVNVNNLQAFRFAKALGFNVECVMTKYGPEGHDYYMMFRR